MVNVITELEKRNKELLNEIEQLKAPLQFKQLNNEEIREWIATVLSESHYTSNPDVDIVDAIMEKIHFHGETWSDFCKLFPTEVARRRVIFSAYQYYPYYKQSGVHWQVRNKAKRDIFINLIKLNSGESKELFRKWLREGKIEDNLTLKGILEKGYEGWNSISVSCYDYYDLRNLSLDELISSWNELTFKTKENFDKVSKQNHEYEEINKELKTEQKNLEREIEELEERVDIEVEMNLKALDKAEEWHERKNFEIAMRKDVIIFDQLQTIEKLKKDLDVRDEKIAKLTKPKKLQQLRKLANKTKEKINSKVNIIKESFKGREQKFQAYILQQFETHVLKQ